MPKVEPILFIESVKTEAHPELDFVALELKSGGQYLSVCLPIDVAKALLEKLEADVTKVVLRKDGDKVATTQRPSNKGTSV